MAPQFPNSGHVPWHLYPVARAQLSVRFTNGRLFLDRFLPNGTAPLFWTGRYVHMMPFPHVFSIDAFTAISREMNSETHTNIPSYKSEDKLEINSERTPCPISHHPKMTTSSNDFLSWTNQDPRESQLFNNWGIQYRFQVNPTNPSFVRSDA
jgi:hypothetical protein